jgi:hypothetical protein
MTETDRLFQTIRRHNPTWRTAEIRSEIHRICVELAKEMRG